jgi:hypothetical protein
MGTNLMTRMLGFIKQRLKKTIRSLKLVLLNVGFDPGRLHLRALRHYPKYHIQYKQFKKLGGVITHSFPIISDYDAQAGTANGHYFHQDLLVASFIHGNNPVRHIDIGSRIDGFVAHVASFRKIEVIDVRDLSCTGHQNISFVKVDMMNSDNAQSGITDSISCLHAIEHFGLGRYGDTLDPDGHRKGFDNIVRMLKKGGRLYISFPIGKSNEIHFNAHRVFHPRDIFTWEESGGSLQLERFDYVDDAGSLHQNIDIRNVNPNVSHGCGIYTFSKNSGSSSNSL